MSIDELSFLIEKATQQQELEVQRTINEIQDIIQKRYRVDDISTKQGDDPLIMSEMESFF
jgi:hypothetical protein